MRCIKQPKNEYRRSKGKAGHYPCSTLPKARDLLPSDLLHHNHQSHPLGANLRIIITYGFASPTLRSRISRKKPHTSRTNRPHRLTNEFRQKPTIEDRSPSGVYKTDIYIFILCCMANREKRIDVLFVYSLFDYQHSQHVQLMVWCVLVASYFERYLRSGKRFKEQGLELPSRENFRVPTFEMTALLFGASDGWPAPRHSCSHRVIMTGWIARSARRPLQTGVHREVQTIRLVGRKESDRLHGWSMPPIHCLCLFTCWNYQTHYVCRKIEKHEHVNSTLFSLSLSIFSSYYLYFMHGRSYF